MKGLHCGHSIPCKRLKTALAGQLGCGLMIHSIATSFSFLRGMQSAFAWVSRKTSPADYDARVSRLTAIAGNSVRSPKKQNQFALEPASLVRPGTAIDRLSLTLAARALDEAEPRSSRSTKSISISRSAALKALMVRDRLTAAYAALGSIWERPAASNSAFT